MIDPRELNLNFTLGDLKARMPDRSMPAQPVSETQGLLSRIGSGASRVGSGLLGAGRDIGRAVAPVAPQALMNIADTMRFYQAAQMQQPSLVTADDLDKLRPINPAGIAAMLPQLRAEEQAAMQKPMLDMLGAQAAARRASGSQSAQKTSPKTYLTIDESGNRKIVETYFDKISGQRLMSGTNEPVPVGSMELSEGDSPTAASLDKVEKDVYEDEGRLRALDSYLADVEGSRQGINNLIDRASATIKTLINDKELTEAELRTAKGRSKLQGLLGNFRIDIVGGGVMTEQDALRILSALGGDFTAFQNKQITKELIEEIRGKTATRYERGVAKFNRMYGVLSPVSYLTTAYKPIELYANPFAVKNNPDDIDALLNKPEYQ
jgi:hypothetical protein